MIGDIVSGLLGGIGGLIGDKYTMDRQQDAADQAYSRTLDMSNTAYQRATADMKAAGLNPMLAYSQGGASAASAIPAGVPNFGDIAAPAVSNASQARDTLNRADQVQSQIANTNAATASSLADAAYKTKSAGNLPAANTLAQASADQAEATAQEIKARIPGTRANATRSTEQLAGEESLGPGYRQGEAMGTSPFTAVTRAVGSIFGEPTDGSPSSNGIDYQKGF